MSVRAFVVEGEIFLGRLKSIRYEWPWEEPPPKVFISKYRNKD